MMGFYLSGLWNRARRRVLRLSRAEKIWIGVFAFHFIVSMVGSYRRWEMPDEGAYTNLAVNIAEHGKFESDYELFNAPKNVPMTHYSPVWPALIAIPWVFGLGERGMFIILGLVWCLNAWLISRCGEELGVRPRFRWLAVAWLTLDPIYFYYHAHLMTEPLTIGLGLALFLTGFRFFHHPHWNTVGPFALISGFAHLARGQIIFIPVALWAVMVFTRPPKVWAKYLGAFVVVHALVIAPWLMRMEAVGAGGLFPERKLGFNLYTFNAPNVINPYNLAPNEAVVFSEDLEKMTPRERDERLTQLALESISTHKMLYVKRCLYRLGYLLSPFAAFTTAHSWRAWGLALATVLFFYSLWLAVFIEGVRVGRWGREEIVMLVAIGLWYLFHILVNASIRNRMPSDAWLALLALSLFSRRLQKESVNQ